MLWMSMLRARAALIPASTTPLLRTGSTLGKTSQSRWYWRFGHFRSGQKLWEDFLNWCWALRGLQVQWLFQSSLVVTSKKSRVVCVGLLSLQKQQLGKWFLRVLRTDQLETDWETLRESSRKFLGGLPLTGMVKRSAKDMATGSWLRESKS